MNKEAMKQTSSVKAEGAELVFDVQGSGTPIILIPGAGGDSSVYGLIAPMLSDQYTVITYDRRCNARSSGDVSVDMDMKQQARDAVAVLHAAGFKRGICFGNSGGANIALQVASDFPESVALLVAHEPPTINLLPDKTDIGAFVQSVYSASQTEGVGAAMAAFARSLVGFENTGAQTGSPDQAKSMTYFFNREYLNITFFVPDLAAIEAARIPVIMLAGEKSGEAFYVRTAQVIAERLKCPFVRVPGNHLAFIFEPVPFAQSLRRVIEQYSTSPPAPPLL